MVSVKGFPVACFILIFDLISDFRTGNAPLDQKVFSLFVGHDVLKVNIVPSQEGQYK